MEDRRICKDLCSVHEARQPVQVRHVLRRGEPWLVVLAETIHTTVIIDGDDQSRSGVCLPMIKACDSLPGWRNLKGSITNDDLIRVLVQDLVKEKFSTAGLMDNFLLAIPGSLRTVLSPLELGPFGIALRVGSVMNPYDCYS